VVLDESPENFQLLIDWLFRSSDFQITQGIDMRAKSGALILVENAETLFELANKDEAAPLAQEVAVFPILPTSGFWTDLP
jgi:hypothetical protein